MIWIHNIPVDVQMKRIEGTIYGVSLHLVTTDACVPEVKKHILRKVGGKKAPMEVTSKRAWEEVHQIEINGEKVWPIDS